MTKQEESLEQIATGLNDLLTQAIGETPESIRAQVAKDLDTGRSRVAFAMELNPPSLVCWISQNGGSPIEFFRCSIKQVPKVARQTDMTVN